MNNTKVYIIASGGETRLPNLRNYCAKYSIQEPRSVNSKANHL